MAAKRILLTSRDPALLETRRLILAGAGYEVFAASDHREVVDLCKDRSFDLLILGHTIPTREKQNILHTVHDACGLLPVLELKAEGAQTSGNILDVYADSSPDALIAKVRQILGNAP